MRYFSSSVRLTLLATVLALALSAANAFYLPGVAPVSYQKGEILPLLVNRLDSTESIIPYDYYHFDFCEYGEEVGAKPGTVAHEGAKVSENLGQIVLGERIRHSPYKIHMKEDIACAALCQPKTYDINTKADVKKFRFLLNAIKKDYMHHWILDNLPVAECTHNCRPLSLTTPPLYRTGFPLGCALGEERASYTICTGHTIANMYANQVFLNNHVDIEIFYHDSPEFEGSRIVGVQVTPKSIAHNDIDDLQCKGSTLDPLAFKLDADHPSLNVVYTYSVVFYPSDIKWASRWDTYLRSSEGASIHWFSIINSLIIVVFLSAMLGVVLVKTLHKDISRYNSNENTEEATEEFGWKLVHGDVFRAPSNGMLLSVTLGVGTQLTIMVVSTILFAMLGFLSPATRGGLMTAMIVLYVCLGTPAGYVSARMYKMFGGEKWKSNVMLTAFLYPGIIFVVIFILNLVLWSDESSAALPFGTMLALVFLWFLISVPLTFVGAYLGFKKPPMEQSVRTNPIPRQVPAQSLYTQPLPAIIMGGILPFGCIFIQLFFILNSIWGHKLYYIFGFLFVVFVILAITTIESTILLCYFHLCAEDYHWWWRAFLTAGSSAVYFLFYAMFFYYRRLEADGMTNLVLFFGYTFIMALLFWLVSGTVGFFGCFYFIQKIYSVVKVD